ncbi:MAG TPA: DHA2 family efflux MFS transporter permease subunit [Polyangiaceae bacterium]|nr:DHA2 family efflux MFS transporter permease subunit [Polyangiaceae bacterium]
MSKSIAPRAPVNKWLVTLSVTFGTLMGTIDASIVNVATPHLRGAMGATVEEITWVTTGFVIANVIVMPLTAFFGRFFGQKRVYMAALALFVFGSGLCGLAHSLPALVAFRLIQGLGAGALQPTEQAILRQTFPPEEQGMAMALFGVAVVIGPAFGPTLGGYIVDNYSWQWIFYINLPVGALALFMVSRFVHEPEDIRAANLAMAAKQRQNLDWQGIALLAVGVATLQYVLEEGNRNDWFDSRLISGCALLSVIALAAFVIRELTATVPAVNISLFKDPVFTSGTLIGSVMFAMLLAITFLLPVFMQELLGFTAVQAGLALMPRSLTMMVMMPIVGRVYNRVSPRLTVAFGVLLFTISAFMMSQYNLNTTSGDVVAVLVIQGVAFACLFIPLTTVALARIPRHKLADATGLNALLRQIGGSLGLAIFASLIPRFTKTSVTALSAHLDPGRPELIARLSQITQALRARGYDLNSAQIAARRALAGVVGRQATVLTFDKLFLLSGILFLVVLPLLLFLKSPDHGRKAAVDTHVEI